ncbi:MAG: winged helix-turn-helix domain-containing protein [Clostridium sp.]|nr:winged helix-turn-helix domain-containing protein [Clostridium sp.]
MLILSFEDNEQDMLNHIVSWVNGKTETFRNVNANLVFSGMEINEVSRLVIRNNSEVELTYTEFEILNLLARHPGMVFSKEQIYDAVWKEPYYGDYNIVMSHIRHIREKIEDDPGKPIYIQTVWGIGYRFNKNLSSGL